jgi:uncharacterized protein (TIGR02145 family)
MKNIFFRKNASVKAGANMKVASSSFLVLAMTVVLLSPVVLSAQSGNGVTVKNLVVNTGSPTTVTFDVSWEKPMPVEPWSDTVWVFVDYNDAGVMRRLELTDATLSAPSTPTATVTVPLPNNKGAWVVGNARSASSGSFSATVKLLTATVDLSGACVYASNYPPVGEYVTASSITFTGTPPFDLVLSPGGQISVQTGYELPGCQTLTSFSDKTGAPGIIKCVPPTAYTLTASASGFCTSDEGITFSLDGTQTGRKYQLYKDGTALVGTELSGNGSAQTFPGGPFNMAGVYTAKSVAESGYCAVPMTGSHNVVAYPAITAGAITSATATTNVGTAPTQTTIASTGEAWGGSGSYTYLWLRTGTSSPATLTTGDNMTAYTITSSDYSTAGTYYFNRYAKDKACATAVWVAASGTYTLGVVGTNQLQGGCTFTQPAVVGTFANFSSTYSASTFVTLTDERDNNNYTVVKIGSRWIMAQNLNYQGVANTSSSLTWQAKSNQPSTSEGSNKALIGHFWCPGKDGSTSSARKSCDVWGALYSWETAMMLDGKGSWTEVAGYCTGAANTPQCKKNWGRTASSGTATGGRGICPPNWHVPTDYEWGVIYDGMESGGGNTHQNTNTTGTAIGANAGSRAKATCTCTSGNCSTDSTSLWQKGNTGSDYYNFRAIPTGYRNFDGSSYLTRGSTTQHWSSSATASTNAATRSVSKDFSGVAKFVSDRSHALTLRCIRDE